MSTGWRVEFSVMVLLAEELPDLHRLYRPEDDLWDEWAERFGYSRSSARELTRIRGLSIPLGIQATMARILPARYLPFYWEDEEWNRPPGSFKDAQGEIKYGGIPEELQKLFYYILCGFMEALPPSPLFDRSDHPVAMHITRLNNALLDGLLIPDKKDERERDWRDMDRVFGCYRLQSRSTRYEEPYRAFRDFVCKADERGYEYWKQRANERMMGIIKRELAGEVEFTGALDAYTGLILGWDSCQRGDDGDDPFSQSLAVMLAESYLDLGLPKEGGIYGKAISIYLDGEPSPRTDLVEEAGRHYFLRPPGTSGNGGKYVSTFTSSFAGLARRIVELSQDSDLLVVARPIVSEEDQLRQMHDTLFPRLIEEDEQRKVTEKAETRRLLTEMRGGN